MGRPEIPKGERESCRFNSRRRGLISGFPGDHSMIFSDSCLIFRTWLWTGRTPLSLSAEAGLPPFTLSLLSPYSIFVFSMFWRSVIQTRTSPDSFYVSTGTSLQGTEPLAYTNTTYTRLAFVSVLCINIYTDTYTAQGNVWREGNSRLKRKGKGKKGLVGKL